MIDEKKLIEEIRNMVLPLTTPDGSDCNDGTIQAYNEALLDILTAIEEQPKFGRWILIEERLSDKAGKYLVTYHPCYWDNVEEDVFVGIDNFVGKTFWSRRKYQKVIAWMPLPKPYKRERKSS